MTDSTFQCSDICDVSSKSLVVVDIAALLIHEYKQVHDFCVRSTLIVTVLSQKIFCPYIEVGAIQSQYCSSLDRNTPIFEFGGNELMLTAIKVMYELAIKV